MASKKEIQKRLEEDKKRLAAYHRGNREAEEEMQGGLPFKHKLIEEVKGKNPKKRRAASKQETRRLVKHGGYDEY